MKIIKVIEALVCTPPGQPAGRRALEPGDAFDAARGAAAEAERVNPRPAATRGRGRLWGSTAYDVHMFKSVYYQMGAVSIH